MKDKRKTTVRKKDNRWREQINERYSGGRRNVK
jgi:hypothetical protein